MAPRAPRTARWVRHAALALVVHAIVLVVFATTATAAVVATTSGTTNTTLMVTEGSVDAQYDVRLDAEPLEPVLVHFDVPTSLNPIDPVRFTSTDWSQPRVIAVRAAVDQIHEPSHTVTIQHQVRSETDGTALSPWEAPVGVVVEDDDWPGVLVSPQGGLSGGEGDRVSWSVSLLSQPTGDVALSFGDDADGTVATPTLVFTPSTWNVPQTVELDIVDDAMYEGAHSTVVTTTVTSTDPTYDALPVPLQEVSVRDNDQAGIVLDAGPSSIVAVTEGTTGRTYTIRLSSQPSANVEIDLASLAGQVTVSPVALTFTPADWASPRIVTVTAIDDTQPEPSPLSDAIMHTANSADPHYASPALPDMPVSVSDDDAPGFIVEDPASMVLEEADPLGTERVLTIRLATQPSAQVRVRASGDSQILLPTSVLTFTTSNWNVPQAMRVQALDDTAAEGPHIGRLSFTILAPDEPTYAALGIASRSFDIVDDDAANASIDCFDGPDWELDAGDAVRLAEDPQSAYHDVGCYLQLGTAPLSDVTVNVGLAPAGQVTVDQPSVTFAAGQQGPVLLTFTTTDDDSAEFSPHLVDLSFGVVSNDPVYGSYGVAGTKMAITDNDRRGVRIEPGGLIELHEGGKEVDVSVSLTSRPDGMVSIVLEHGSDVELIGGATTLQFTRDTWNVPQQVRVKAIDDAWAEAAREPAPITMGITSSDVGYLSLRLEPIAIEVVDNDVPGVVFSHSGGSTEAPEGGPGDSFGIRLATRPFSTVTMTLVADAQLLEVPPLTFTPDNWNAEQVISVQSVQDTVFEGRHEGRITFRLSSQDAAYDSSSGTAVVAPLVVGIDDDEEGGAAISETDGGTVLTEAGGTDTYSVVLKAQPSAEVVIRPDGGGQASANPPSLTFTPANWNVAQAVTLAAVQDDADELDPHVVEIRNAVETTATGWTGIALATIEARITDDDSSEIAVVQSDGATKVAEGAKEGDTVGFRLSSRPTKEVVITATADPQLKLASTQVVLTPDAWKDPLEISVLANDDKAHEGDHTGTLTFAVASEDASYAKAVVGAITVAIKDNDSDVTIMPNDDGGGGIVDEDDEEEGTRTPRGNGGGTGGTRSGGSTSERRTRDGASRTAQGAQRTEDGAGESGFAGGARGGAKEQPEEEPEELHEEVVSAAEHRKPRRKPRPNPVVRAMNRASAWVKENQDTAATVGGLGMMAAAAGTFLLRGDPIKVAQRGLSSAMKKGPGTGSEGSGERRRGRPRKKKRDEEDEDATES